MIEFKTIKEATSHLRNVKAKGKIPIYYNIYGWTTYFTLEPTFATPTGNHPDFPRCYYFTN